MNSWNFPFICRYGEIQSIRVLHERFCAFVNFKSASMAARAMEKLNVSLCLLPLLIFWPFTKEHCCGLRALRKLPLTGLLYWEHTFSCALSGPSHSKGPPYSTEDLSTCHTAGRGSCRVTTTWDSLCKLSGTSDWVILNCVFCVVCLSAQTTTTWPGERRWVLLLENNRLSFWGQVSLQTHSWSERQGQKALAAVRAVYSLPHPTPLPQNWDAEMDFTSWTSLPKGKKNVFCSRMDRNSEKDQRQQSD